MQSQHKILIFTSFAHKFTHFVTNNSNNHFYVVRAKLIEGYSNEKSIFYVSILNNDKFTHFVTNNSNNHHIMLLELIDRKMFE